MLNINSITIEDMIEYRRIACANINILSVFIQYLESCIKFEKEYGTTQYKPLIVPYEELPLLIGHSSYVESEFIMWRLYIRK